MTDVHKYTQILIAECRKAFCDRLLYVGLQGSNLRSEVTDKSDIDVMVIIDVFSVNDTDVYREILHEKRFYEKSCGFICGKEELMRWNPLEVCALLHTTKDLFGKLSSFLPPSTRQDEINYVKLSLGNLYHELCHSYIHADKQKNAAAFRNICKGVFFIIQNLHYLESGCFIITKRELKERVSEDYRSVLELSELPDNYDYDFAFRQLFRWCRDTFIRADRLQ